MSRVLVGMSGGVDSSVSAYLLKQQGYDCIGVTFKLWEDLSEDAKAVCEKIGIPHISVDLKKEFRETVIQNFLDEYMNARTPNPCVFCNRTIKWHYMLSLLDEYDADYVATGHYSKIIQLENERFTIKKPLDISKDQTYVLYSLSQNMLKKTLMPLSDYTKEEVRQIARDAGLIVAEKKDSQDICFIPDGDYISFIKNEIKEDFPKEGDFVSINNEILGKHKGITNYTIGQRKGLGIALGKRMFVVNINPKTNQVILGDDKDTYNNSLIAGEIRYMSSESFDTNKTYIAKIRYSHEGSPCRIKSLNDDTIKVDFLEGVRAITPGQSVVFYEDDYIVGGGIIKK